MQNLESILAFTCDIAQQAGDLIVKMRAEAKLNIQYKNNIELVTDADLASEQLICNAINAQFPDHKILAEETLPTYDTLEKDVPLWVIDPIDGTVNYSHHHSQVAVSIAYMVNGKVMVAVVYSPFQAEMFCAIRNQGAWLNDQPLRCSQTKTLNKAIIATGFPYDKQHTLGKIIQRLEIVLSHCADIRRLGSAALDICWVAMGRMDGYYESVSPWDFAAAQLIAKEAGAQFGHYLTPDPSMPAELNGNHILIANPNLFLPLKKLLAEVE